MRLTKSGVVRVMRRREGPGKVGRLQAPSCAIDATDATEASSKIPGRFTNSTATGDLLLRFNGNLEGVDISRLPLFLLGL